LNDTVVNVTEPTASRELDAFAEEEVVLRTEAAEVEQPASTVTRPSARAAREHRGRDQLLPITFLRGCRLTTLVKYQIANAVACSPAGESIGP
jgi:hypothetical protein